MSSPCSPALQKLDLLNRPSPDFHDQLNNILHGEDYRQCALNLQGDDLVWLVDYLDEVRRHVDLPHSTLSQRRHSTVSIPQVLFPRSVYVNSEAYVAIEGYSQRRTLVRLTSSALVPTRLLRVVMVMCTKDPSMAQGFASNVCGCILWMAHKRRLKCVVDAIAFPRSPPLTKLTDLLPRSRNMETLETSKHSTLTGCHHRSPPAHFGLDVWRGPARVH